MGDGRAEAKSRIVHEWHSAAIVVVAVVELAFVACVVRSYFGTASQFHLSLRLVPLRRTRA